MAGSPEPGAERALGTALREALSAAPAALRATPAALPTALALAVLAFLAAHDDRSSLWWPAGLVLAGILAATALGIPGAWRRAPGSVRAAVLALAALTVWSFASIAWADARGDALTGADRTLVYLVVFALFALWPVRPGLATALISAWVGVLVLLAAVVLVRVVLSDDPVRWFIGGRLATPLRYPNGAAALWLMAAWPAVMLAARRELPWGLRGALAGGAVLLAELAVLAQSRGAVIATGLCAALAFVLARDRVRLFCALGAVAAGVGAAAPAILRAADRYDDGHRTALQGVAWQVLGAALAVAALVALGAAVDGRWRPPGGHRAATRRALSRTLAVGSALALIGALAFGHPARRVRSAAHSFTHGYAVASTGSRLTSGLGSNRYDFYRVAWGQLRRSPLVGAGADNFFQDYLGRGRSDETPHYPHSVELRTLGQLGVVGAALLLAFLAAAARTLARARRGSPAVAGTAVAAAMAFAYWFVHGSADWFWELVPLGAPAFALLGLACAQAPRRAQARSPLPARTRQVAAVALGLAAGAALLALALPWLADRDVARAAAGWQRSPAAAFDRLHLAADLDPLSDDALVTEGVIAAYQGDLAHAARALHAALGREPRDQYAVLVLGVVQADRGERTDALALLRRAGALYPRGVEAQRALARVREGGRVDLIALNARLEAISVALSR